MKETENRKYVGIVAGRDEEINNLFKCILYSDALKPTYTLERVLPNEESLEKLKAILEDQKFTWRLTEIKMKPADWEKSKAEFAKYAEEIAKGLEQDDTRLEEQRKAKLSEIEKKAKVSNLKIWSKRIIPIVVTAAIVAGGFQLFHKDGSKNAPDLASTTPATTMGQPTVAVDARITALKDKFAKGEMFYDLTNPTELANRQNIFAGYFSNLTEKSLFTEVEARDAYLLLNGFQLAEDYNVDKLLRRLQYVLAYENCNWRETEGKEIIAVKRNSAQLDIYLKVLMNLKDAAKGENSSRLSAAYKEAIITCYYGINKQQDLEIKNVGEVNIDEWTAPDSQYKVLAAFNYGFVTMALKPKAPSGKGYDIVAVGGTHETQFGKINVNSVVSYLDGPHTYEIYSGTGATQEANAKKGQGMAQVTMKAFEESYRAGEYPSCSSIITSDTTVQNNGISKTLK